MTESTDARAAHHLYVILRAVAISLTLALAAGTVIADTARERTARQASDEEFYRSAAVFNEVFHEIQSKYWKEVDTKTLMEAAIRGMFLALDPHSQYMGPQSFDQLTQSTTGEFYGIGIHITIRDGVLTVIAPIPDSPSAKLGIQPWDRIIEINGESTEGMALNEAVDRLKGPRGTQVNIRVFRTPEEKGGEPQYLDFTITRDEITIQSVFSRVIDDKVGYIRLAQFSDDTGKDLRRAIHDLQDKGVQGLILDLRFNTGGLLSQAIEVCDLFLPRGDLVVSTDGRLPNQVRRYYSENDALTDLPMLVLVNDGSASASEIVAGALQDHHRALIVGPEGETTFGKGSVQTIEELQHTLDYDENGNPRTSAIRLTTAHYLTPSGRSIHEVGITPDIGIPLPTGQRLALLQHGLLGEPDTVEPEAHVRAVQEGLGASEENHRGPRETPSVTPPDQEQPQGENLRERPSRPPVAPERLLEEQMDHERRGGHRPEGEQINENTEEPAPDSVHEVDMNELRGETQPEDDGQFHDVLLDESIRLLKVHLLMGRDAA
jgi:carboxyl-terminal processing protease